MFNGWKFLLRMFSPAVPACVSVCLLGGLLTGMTAFAGAARAADSAVVFIYHRFGDDRHPSTSIDVSQLRPQLEYLRDAGYEIISLGQLVEHITTQTQVPENAIVITIDDAFRSTYEAGFPLFLEFDVPFTVFVSTDAVDADLPDYMSWEQMREMASAGVSFANHGAGHLHMVQQPEGESRKAWMARMSDEIDRAAARLRAEIPTDALVDNAFAYPYGEYSEELAELVRERGYVAFGQQSGALSLTGDLRALPRYPMAEAFGELSGFSTKAASLPMPVSEFDPWDPMIDDRTPVMHIRLQRGLARAAQTACYVSGQGRVTPEWDSDGLGFTLRVEQDLPPGRQRVNCTTPTSDGRYYWFGHQWVVGD